LWQVAWQHRIHRDIYPATVQQNPLAQNSLENEAGRLREPRRGHIRGLDDKLNPGRAPFGENTAPPSAHPDGATSPTYPTASACRYGDGTVVHR
jgi:hypothetical protein